MIKTNVKSCSVWFYMYFSHLVQSCYSWESTFFLDDSIIYWYILTQNNPWKILEFLHFLSFTTMKIPLIGKLNSTFPFAFVRLLLMAKDRKKYCELWEKCLFAQQKLSEQRGRVERVVLLQRQENATELLCFPAHKYSQGPQLYYKSIASVCNLHRRVEKRTRRHTPTHTHKKPHISKIRRCMLSKYKSTITAQHKHKCQTSKKNWRDKYVGPGLMEP